MITHISSSIWVVPGYLVIGLLVFAAVEVLRKELLPILRFRNMLGNRRLVKPTFLVLVFGAAILILLNGMYAGFILVSISDRSMVLGYVWPRRPVQLQLDAGLKIRAQPCGNGRRSVIEIISGADTFISTGMRTPVAKEAVAKFQRQVDEELLKMSR